jgi:hypothetical protein
LVRPAAHALQPLCSKSDEHTAQAAPAQRSLQVQLQPVVASPVTALAWFEQSAAIVQVAPQVG